MLDESNPKFFEQLVERVQDRNIVANPFTTQNFFRGLSHRVDGQFNLSPYAETEPDLNAVKSYVIGEIERSSFSTRFKNQLANHVKELNDLDDILIWISSHETRAHYAN